jgi:hypothetical protein
MLGCVVGLPQLMGGGWAAVRSSGCDIHSALEVVVNCRHQTDGVSFLAVPTGPFSGCLSVVRRSFICQIFMQ